MKLYNPYGKINSPESRLARINFIVMENALFNIIYIIVDEVWLWDGRKHFKPEITLT